MWSEVDAGTEVELRLPPASPTRPLGDVRGWSQEVVREDRIK